MTHFKTIWPDFCIFIYIIYIYIIYTYMHHMHTYVPLKRCMYTCTIINTCVTSTTKNISEDSCTTYTYMHHQEHMSGYMHPQTHTCTTYTYMHHQIPPENKICLVDLTSVLYERPNQNERFLLNNMFFSAFHWNAQCISLKCAMHFSEMHSSVKCAVHFTEMPKLAEMHWTFQWNAQRISVKCTVHFSVHFTEMPKLAEMRCAFQWNALHFSAIFDELLGFPPSIGLSDIRKTKNKKGPFWISYQITFNLICYQCPLHILFVLNS